MLFVSPRRAARCIALVAAVFSCSQAATAQDMAEPPAPDPVADLPSGALDPNSPLQPMPDLGVDWPDLTAPDDTIATGSAAATVDVAADQRYRLTIEGLDVLEPASRETLRERFNLLSTLVDGEDKPANVAQIDRRAREDEGTLRDLLRAHGYYDASVQARVENDAASGRILVTLSVEPGPVYRFTSVDVQGLAEEGDTAALRDAYPVEAKDPVDAEKVIAAETNLRLQLGRQGFAFGKIGETEVVIDHETRTATLTLDVDPGSEKRFGAIEIRGRPLFSARHLGRIARFQPGDPYDSALVEDFRRALIATGLVSSVTLAPEPGSASDTVDLAVTLERAPPRTIAGEIGYGTGEGFRAEVSWQHRNLIKPEGAVTFRGVAGTQEQLLGASLRRSNYKARDRVLTAQIVASHTDRNAYDAKTFSLGVGLERHTNIIWQKTWTWSIGAELVASDERDVIVATGQPRRRTFFIGAFPTTLAYDGSDDLLNPTSGYRLSGRLSPEASFQGSAFGYAKAQIDGSLYMPVNDRTTVAGRVRIGSITGASRDRIAPSRRFYAGGGGSVRGYGYQDIGPRDVNNDPIGGRSLAEFSLEARVRFGDFGVVPFIDGGNLYTEALPRFTGLRYGAGIGARYYTSFGPIRVDVGTPLNPRRGDPRLAVYVSLGQAF